MTTVPAVQARGLTKSYGRHRGIVDIDMDVARGEVLGLVGVNGAGKTTFMRTLLNFIRPTSGSLSVFGKSVTRESVAVRRMCTYLPGELVVPGRLNGYQALRRFSFTRRDLTQDRVDDLARRLDLDLERRVGDLSKGNRQKLGLVLAFAPRADLMVLDEPTSGLDPVLQRTFADLVADAVAGGSTVLLSSHVMSEVEQIAHRVALLREGAVAVVDDVAALLARSRRRASVRPSNVRDLPALADALSALRAVESLQRHDDTLTFACQGSVDPVVKALAGFSVESLTLAHADLEDAFFAADQSQPGSGGAL